MGLYSLRRGSTPPMLATLALVIAACGSGERQPPADTPAAGSAMDTTQPPSDTTSPSAADSAVPAPPAQPTTRTSTPRPSDTTKRNPLTDQPVKSDPQPPPNPPIVPDGE